FYSSGLPLNLTSFPTRRSSDLPTQRKVNPADFPILNLALTSATQPLSVVDDYAENLLAQRISTISGVAQVQVYGSQKYAVRIQRSEEHTSELQSLAYLVCRLLL